MASLVRLCGGARQLGALRRAAPVLLSRRQGALRACQLVARAARRAPDAREADRSERLARLEAACASADGEAERALRAYARALRASPADELVGALERLCALIDRSTGASPSFRHTHAEQALLASERLIAERVREMSAAQLGRLVGAFARCAVVGEHTSEASAQRIRELVRSPAYAADAVREMSALGPHMSEAVARPAFQAMVDAVSYAEGPEADAPVSQLPCAALGQLAHILVEWRGSQRQGDFRERDIAERGLLLVFARAGRAPQLRALVESACGEGRGASGGGGAGAQADDPPLVRLLRAACAFEPRALAAGGAAGAARPSDLNRTRAARAEAGAFMRAAVRQALRRLPALGDRALAALLEASERLAAGALDGQARQSLARELGARERSGRLPGSVLVASTWLAAHAPAHGWIVDAAMHRAIDELRDAATARAAAEGRELEPPRAQRYGAAGAPLPAPGGAGAEADERPARAPLSPRELGQLAVAYVRLRQPQLAFRGQFRPAERRVEAELFAELAGRVAADRAFVGELGAPGSAELLVAMTRVGLGSLPALHALLAAAALGEGGLRGAQLGGSQLANLIWALGKTATLTLAAPAGAPPEEPPPAGACHGAAWLWSELTEAAAEQLTGPRASTSEAARALWGISQAGRYLLGPLRELAAHVIARLEALGQPAAEPARAERGGARGGRPAFRAAGAAHSAHWRGWGASTEAMLFLALAAIDLEAPAALPPIRPETWAALQAAHEASTGGAAPRTSELQLEVCAALGALGLRYESERVVQIPLRTSAAVLSYVVDVRVAGLPLLIEVHGAPHLLFGGTHAYCSQKHRLLRMHGFKVVEVFAHRWNAHRGSQQKLALHLADLLASDAGLLVRHQISV